jgi:hypothetical protein
VLLLIATAHQRARSAERIRGLAATVDHSALHSLLVEQRLLALVGTRLATVPGVNVPEWFEQEAIRAREGMRSVGVVQELIALRVLAGLEAAGVPAASLKGPVLARGLYADPGLRLSGDIDVLVPADRLTAAVRTVVDLGWQEPPGPLGPDLPRLHHALPHSGGLPPVELHWRVHWYGTGLSAAALERAEPSVEGGRRLLPSDELAIMLLFYARDGLAGLRHPADLAAWWDKHGSSASAGVLDEAYSGHPELRRALVAALAVAKKLTGLPHRALLSPGLGRHPSAVAVQMANPWLLGTQIQVAADATLVDALLTPPPRLGEWFRRHIVPPRHDLFRRHPEFRDAGRLGLLQRRVARAVRIVLRYPLALRRALSASAR